MRNQRRFVVLGGAGTIGRVVVRDLFESHPDNRIWVADHNEEAALAVARRLDSLRVGGVFVDAHDPGKLVQLLKGRGVVINCLQHTFNLKVMEAALAAGVHYVDLGGLFTWTRKQLRLQQKFYDAKLTAVIGMGCSPGITNMLVAYADTFLQGPFRSIKIRVGSVDLNPPPPGKLRLPYSAQTVIEELTLKPWIWSAGKFRQTEPRTGWELTEFPDPVRKIWTVQTRHSEIATLPLNFSRRKPGYCDFKVGFDKRFVREIMQLLRAGWTLQEFNQLLTPVFYPNDYEISRVIVNDWAIDCHARSKPEWQATASDVDTGCPASIVAQMIAEGVINRRGVSPPETAVPCRPFFTELEKRGLKIAHSCL